MKAGFCYTLALLVFLSKQYGSEGKSRVSLQTSSDKIFISRCRFKKPFILRYLSILHVVIFFLNKSSPKMLQTFSVDESSLSEVLAGPGPVSVPITLTVRKYA